MRSKPKPFMLMTTKNVTILIIEREWTTAVNLRRQLVDLGYVVEIAHTYEAAIRKVRSLHIDLILLKTHLEEKKDSAEVAKVVYTEFQIPAIFLTTHVEYKTLNQKIKNYPFACIIEPFQESNLDSSIRLMLLHRTTERKLREKIQKEKELNELKSQFLSTISHELRNPLSCVMMILKILIEQDGELSSDSRRMYLNRGQNMIRSLNKLLSDTLVIEEIEYEQFRCNPASINIAHFCRNLAEELKCSNSQQLNFTIQADDYFEYLFYELDSKLLRHILTNLLSNAIKYSSPDSRVDFRLICEPDSVTFQVQDYGIGIPHQDRDKLFTAFNRAKNVGKISGTGLGLAIVRKCVDAHGGIIELESEEGTGTTVTVQLRTQRDCLNNAKCG